MRALLVVVEFRPWNQTDRLPFCHSPCYQHKRVDSLSLSFPSVEWEGTKIPGEEGCFQGQCRNVGPACLLLVLPLSPSLSLFQPEQPPPSSKLQTRSCPGASAWAVPSTALPGPWAPTLKHNKLPRWAGPRDCQARAGQLGGAELGGAEPALGRGTYGNQNKELSPQPHKHLGCASPTWQAWWPGMLVVGECPDHWAAASGELEPLSDEGGGP